MKVFIGSPYKKLVEERAAVFDALRHDYEIERMEDFGSTGLPPIDTCLTRVEDSDAYILIAGYRYGSLEPGADLAYTEAEYEHALSHTIPVLAYIKDKFNDGVAASGEPPELQQRLREFKALVEAEMTVDQKYFQSPDELARKVRADTDRLATTGTRRPTYPRALGRVRTPRAYAIDNVRRNQARLFPLPVVLVNLAAAAQPNYPTAAAGRLARKVIEVFNGLDSKEVQVINFNELEVTDLRGGTHFEQRLAWVKASNAAVICFVRNESDLERLEAFRDIDDLAVWSPAHIDSPADIAVVFFESYTTEQLDESTVAEHATAYAERRVGDHTLRATLDVNA